MYIHNVKHVYMVLIAELCVCGGGGGGGMYTHGVKHVYVRGVKTTCVATAPR